jgi:Rieske Fe-S protein
MKRRTFFQQTIKYTSLSGLSLLTLFGLFPELINQKKSIRKVILGNASKLFSVGKALVRKVNDETVIIVQKESGVIEAFSAKCTHAGCMVEWKEAQHAFLCKCHGGVFNEKGDPIAGPPKKPLNKIQVDIRKSSDEIILYLDDKSA